MHSPSQVTTSLRPASIVVDVVVVVLVDFRSVAWTGMPPPTGPATAAGACPRAIEDPAAGACPGMLVPAVPPTGAAAWAVPPAGAAESAVASAVGAGEDLGAAGDVGCGAGLVVGVAVLSGGRGS